jgi:hypothetical protein
MTEFNLYKRICGGDLRPNLEKFKRKNGLTDLYKEFYSKPITIDKDFPEKLHNLFDLDFLGIKEGDKVELKIDQKNSKIILRRLPNPDEEDLINLDVPPPIDRKSELFHRIITDEYRRIKTALVKKLEEAQDLDALKLYVIKNIQHGKELAKEAHLLQKKIGTKRNAGRQNPNNYILDVLKIYLIYSLIDIQEIFKLFLKDKIQTQYELEDELFEFQHTRLMAEVERFSDEMSRRFIERIYTELGEQATIEEKIELFKNKLIDHEKIINQKIKSREGIAKFEYDKKELFENELGKLLSNYYFNKLVINPDIRGIKDKYDNLLKAISRLRQSSDSIETKTLKRTDFFDKVDIEINLLRELINSSSSIPIADSLLKDLISLILILQSRKHLDLDENEWNDYLTDLLRVKQYYVADQSRSGFSGSTSKKKVNSGELDITIRDLTNNGIIKTIIEAFKLSSCGKNNKSIQDHINRLIERYDTSGNEENYIIVYSISSDFSSLWNKYLNHVENVIFKNKYKLIEIEYPSIPRLDIKIGISTIMRYKREMRIYHLFLNMRKNYA